MNCKDGCENCHCENAIEQTKQKYRSLDRYFSKIEKKKRNPEKINPDELLDNIESLIEVAEELQSIEPKYWPVPFDVVDSKIREYIDFAKNISEIEEQASRIIRNYNDRIFNTEDLK